MDIQYYKYPRTPHLPWSPGATSDDIRIIDTAHFEGKEVVASVKKDGESTSLYADGKIHARSIDSKSHPSRDWIKRVAAEISYELPAGWRISLENLYAEHTIHYYKLRQYAEVIAIWDEMNFCLSWDTILEWCELLGLVPVDVIYRGIYNEAHIKSLYSKFDKNGDLMEGYVVRVVDGFSYSNFSMSVAKYVASEFKENMEANGDKHWTEKHKYGIITNTLA